MFRSLQKWWQRRRRLRERALLRYWDGSIWRHGDPFAIWRKLINNADVNWEAVAPLVDTGQEPETTQAVQAICEAFDVRRWDEASGTGLTDWEITQLPGALDAYFDEQKKSISPGPTSSGPTAGESSSVPEPRSSTTSFSSDSPSVPPESIPGEPTSSPEPSLQD
jgi:hypothetical protein